MTRLFLVVEVVRFGLDAHYQLVEQSKAKVKSFNATFEVYSILLSLRPFY